MPKSPQGDFDRESIKWLTDEAKAAYDGIIPRTANSRSLKILATNYRKKHETAKAKGRDDNKSLFVSTVLSDLRNAKLLRKALSYVLKEQGANPIGRSRYSAGYTGGTLEKISRMPLKLRKCVNRLLARALNVLIGGRLTCLDV